MQKRTYDFVAWLVVAVILAVMLASGCAGAVPAPAAPEGEAGSAGEAPAEPSSTWEQIRSDVCASHMVMDLTEAASRFHGPIFWTAHLNFYPSVDATAQKNGWLGCLRFYWRDTSNPARETFVGNLDLASSFGCEQGVSPLSAGQPVVETDTQQIVNSRGDDDSMTPPYMVRLSDGAYLICSLDIYHALMALNENGNLAFDDLNLQSQDIAAVEAEIMDMAGDKDSAYRQVYPEFSMAAAVSTLGISYSDAAGNSVENPILFYRADDLGSGADPSSLKQFDVGLAMPFQLDSSPRYHSYSARYAEQTYAPENPQSPICTETCTMHPEDTAVYIWNDFGQILRTAAGQVRNREDLGLLDDPATGSCQPNVNQTVYLEFWSRNATESDRLGRCGSSNVAPQVESPRVTMESSDALAAVNLLAACAQQNSTECSTLLPLIWPAAGSVQVVEDLVGVRWTADVDGISYRIEFDGTTGSLYVYPPVQTIDFWIGPATLYVGYDPDTQATFEGQIYEVWVDPDSAIKPSNASSQ